MWRLRVQVHVDPRQLYADANVQTLETADCLLLPDMKSEDRGTLSALVRMLL